MVSQWPQFPSMASVDAEQPGSKQWTGIAYMIQPMAGPVGHTVENVDMMGNEGEVRRVWEISPRTGWQIMWRVTFVMASEPVGPTLLWGRGVVQIVP